MHVFYDETTLCAVYECRMDTHRLSVPSTAVAIRSARAQCPSQRCGASRDLNCCGLNTSDFFCCEISWRTRVQEKECDLCGERSHPALVPLVGHQRHSNFWLEAIMDSSFFPSPRFFPHELVHQPSHWDVDE